MASISKDAAGNRTIQFVGADGKRRSIRLGKVNAKQAESLKIKVETLASSVAAKIPLDSETSAWLGAIGNDLAAKLAAVGLMPLRQSRLLGEFLEGYLEQRQGDSKPSTLANIRQVIADLVAFYGGVTTLRAVTVERAEAFKKSYLTRTKKLADATIYRRLKMARMFFGYAAKLKLIDSNPFSDVKTKNANPIENRQFVSIADTEKLLAVANPVWRTIIALARFGGLRCASEVLMLRWDQIDFATSRMTVSSPKTEHHEGRAHRVVPIFALLRPYLEEAFTQAAPGERYVVGGAQGDVYRASSQGPNGWVNTNLRTTFQKVLKRAGLKQWPRIFQNLRSSRETELMDSHPIHVVTAWMGNTPKVALGHYLQTLEADFAKAVRGNEKSGAESGAVVVQNAMQTGADRLTQEKTEATDSPENVGFRRFESHTDRLGTVQIVPRVGLEPTTR